jgi:hypothetical protein
MIISTRETSDGTLLSPRQACDLADVWPGVDIRECRAELVRDVLVVYHPSGECQVLCEQVRCQPWERQL